MKAITTRYLGATEHRPARIIASDLDDNRITLPQGDHSFGTAEWHRAAAVALCDKLGWPGADTLIGGTVKHGMVWVFPEPPPPARCEGCHRFWDRRQAFSDDGLGPCCGVVRACNLPVVDGSPQGSPCQLRAEHAGRCQARTWGAGTR